MKASIELLNELHNLTVKELIARIRSGEATSADLNVARAMLKDNGVEQAVVAGAPMADLAATLPFAGSDTEDTTLQ